MEPPGWASFIRRFFAETAMSEVRSAPSDPQNQQLKTYPRLPRHPLPHPVLPVCTLADALFSRASAQELTSVPLRPADLSNLLRATGFRGGTGDVEGGRRLFPSAGAKYPTEVYLVALRCEGLDHGLYHYAPREHALETLWTRDLSGVLQSATDDPRLENAGAVLVFSLVTGRVAQKYGSRGLRYALIELGHAAQNVSLMAAALGLDAYEIGGFVDDDINHLLDVDPAVECASHLLALGGRPPEPV
jgi:SagB-type dehydrogenase family enzyme